MNDDLYFIPLLARALAGTEPRAGLATAFAEIRRLGQQARFAAGYAQFETFMRVAAERLAPPLPALVLGLIAEFSAPVIPLDPETAEAFKEMLARHPAWQDLADAIRRMCEDTRDLAVTFRITVLRDGHAIGAITIDPVHLSGAIAQVQPGNYVIALDTGRILWEGSLTSVDLLWSKASPGQPLPLAATTAATSVQPARDETFLDGELRMQIFAGLESGRLQIQHLPRGGVRR